MALKGVKPQAIEKRLKAFFYGIAGVGKTTAAISFPFPYLVDTERGAENDQYTKILNDKGGAVFQTSDFEELLNEVNSLSKERHPYKTLIIDPMTVVYSELLDKCALQKGGTDFGRHYGAAEKKMKHLINLLYRLDMNVIITSHAKTLYGSDLSVIGNTFDCYKKLDYSFDLVVEVQKRGIERVGIIKKSRISSFIDGEQFPFNYDQIADRYGREILERDVIPLDLATQDQVKELLRLIEVMKIQKETTDKWLKKANVISFEEMTQLYTQKCIDYLKSQIQGEAA